MADLLHPGRPVALSVSFKASQRATHAPRHSRCHGNPVTKASKYDTKSVVVECLNSGVAGVTSATSRKVALKALPYLLGSSVFHLILFR